MPLTIKVILAVIMVLVAIIGALASFVFWHFAKEDKGKERDQDDALILLVERVFSVVFGCASLGCWFLVFALVFGAFG